MQAGQPDPVPGGDVEILIGVGVVAAIMYALGWSTGNSANMRAQENAQLSELRNRQAQFERDTATWRDEHRRLMAETEQLHAALKQSFLGGRKWLANAFAEFISTKDAEVECALVLKPSPAIKAAETVSELRRKRTDMARELKFLQYQLASYEEYFPQLLDYRDAILDEVVDLRPGASDALGEVDPALALGYLSKEEYEALSTSEKYQRALDRYWSRHKSDVEIGRVYERFIGYTYERDGWVVTYHGAVKGFEDFGRDLICKRGSQTDIVQCKCWSSSKVIREKHIMQLFGTCILYRLTEDDPDARPVFVTTTALSPEAGRVAMALGVEVRQQSLERYPMIKCNVSRRTGERIYHLPFDQQYDRIVVGDMPGELQATTVEEAEAAGFRRAYRWHGGEADQ
jgi:hypothetical protein